MSGSLSHMPSDIILQLLVDKGDGTLPSANGIWPVFSTREPDKPDSIITIYDTTSKLEGRDHTSGEMVEHYGIQFRIRAADPNDGWRKANAIKTTIDTNTLRTVVSIADTTGTATSSYRIQAITRTSGILSLGKEQSGKVKRNIFTINAIAAILETI